ncbi:TonB-dependent receptor [Sphingopyxis sp.]|uniref:TonB-dependent receptor n=1 Tax=Sphingopyxis sp. TaxID=1908224 RepID=UPI00262BDF76|nr:TonB-dependent receptor [Sphingopyxis sp.]MCW0196601.1 TonB-dependent receptor [Sphingopyxis sp.]
MKLNRYEGVRGASLMILAAALIAPGAAWAQDAIDPSAPVDAASEGEIVVTGFRGSLAKALEEKRREAAAVDSILAEDIGKFPDLNLSESIQRIPGVAITRDGGEGRQISVRGLGPQFTRVRINGMEAMSSAGGADASGGTNRGRGFDFNVFASDLFNEISVRKSAEAATEEGSLGATVDLRTARPFDYNGFTLVASAQGSYNTLAEKASPRGAFLISDTFADGRIGVLLSAAYGRRKTVEEGYSTVRWAKGSSFAPGFESVLGQDCATNPGACAEANDALHPRFPRYDLYTNDVERIGATASIQFRPTDRTLISIDGLYADFKVKRGEAYLEAPSLSAAGACTAATRPTTCGIADTDILAMDIQNGVMVSGTFNDIDLRVENRRDRSKTKFRQLSLDLEQEIGDSLTFTGLVGYSKSDFNNPIQNTVIFDSYNTDGYSYDYSDPRHPVFGFGTANIDNPDAWKLAQLRLRAARAENSFKTVQANLKWQVAEGFDITAGLAYKKYNFDTEELRRSNGTTSNREATIPAEVAAIPLSEYTRLISFAGTSWIIPDYDTAAQVLSLEDPNAYNGAFKLGPEPALGSKSSVGERDKSAYFQANFSTEIGGVTVRGNAGVRYVRTGQTATGFVFTSGTAQEIVVKRSYDDWLPAANIVIEPAQNLLVRLAAARVMARPDLGSLPPGASLSVSGSGRSVSVGNPNLDPYRADTYDAAIEWYFQPGALLSLAVFQKNIDSFVQTVSTPGSVFSDNPFGLPDSVAVAACGSTPNCAPNLNNWTFSAPANSPGGRLRGFEVNYQQPLKFLPGPLGNTGILLNYTQVSSRIKYLAGDGSIAAINDLTGLSKRSANATFYYEDKVISARISGAYRSKYLTRVPGGEKGTDVDGTNSTFNLDASIQFTLNDHFKLSLEAVNLTDEYQDQFNDSRDLLSVYRHTGREFIAGIRYTF